MQLKLRACRTNQQPPFHRVTQLSARAFGRERDHVAKGRRVTGATRFRRMISSVCGRGTEDSRLVCGLDVEISVGRESVFGVSVHLGRPSADAGGVNVPDAGVAACIA